MQTINIITPVSRPENLLKMYDNIFKDTAIFDVIWWICLDIGKNFTIEQNDQWTFFTNRIKSKCNTSLLFEINKNSIVGNHQRNRTLDRIYEGWCMFLDDDNLIHPNFYWEFTRDLINYSPRFKGYIYSQDRTADLGVVLNPTQIGVGLNKTDSSQFILDRKLIGDIRWQEDLYEGDGKFIEDVYKNNEHYFHLSGRILSLRNALRP